MKEHDIAYQELERIDGSINSEHRRVVNLLISLGAQDIVTGNCKRMSRHLALFTRNTTSAIPYLLETKDPVCINRSGHTIVAIHHPPSNQVLAYDGTAAQVVSFNHLPQSALVQFGPFSTFTDLFSNLGRSYITVPQTVYPDLLHGNQPDLCRIPEIIRSATST
jgi:hypothetical protein